MILFSSSLDGLIAISFFEKGVQHLSITHVAVNISKSSLRKRKLGIGGLHFGLFCNGSHSFKSCYSLQGFQSDQHGNLLTDELALCCPSSMLSRDKLYLLLYKPFGE